MAYMAPQNIITDEMMAEWGVPANGSPSFGTPGTRNSASNSNSPALQQTHQPYSPTRPEIDATPPVSAICTTPAENMPVYEQTGSVILGPGSHNEALLLGLGLPRLGHRQKDYLDRAKKYAMEQSIKHVLMKQTVAHQQQQQKVAMYAQALSLMARVYVGSISFELREDTIKNAFSCFGPIKSVNMSWDPITGHHKGFAFIEYEVPEAAMLAQDQMNSILMGGRNIKVGRPSNIPQAQPIIDMITEDAKQCHRIYVASIHADLSENDIRTVFEAFGPIQNIELARGQVASKHRGYAYIDYETEQSAIDAVASMNLFDLGGQNLRVGRAITPPQAREYIAPATNSTLPTAAAVAAAAVTAKIQAMESIAPALRGVNPTPTIVVGSTPPPSGMGGQIFSVPPPGVAIPQALPQLAPSVVTPQLYSVPTTKLNLPPASPAVQQRAGGSPFMPTPVQPPPPPPPSANMYVQQQPVMATTQASTVGSQQQLNAAQIAAQQAALRLQSTATNVNQLSDKQKQLLDLEGVQQTLAAQEDLKIKGNEARNILMHKLMRRTESCVLVLRNMVGPEEVDDSLHDEVAEECSRYGQVEQVVIYQEKQSDRDDIPAIVKIFVKYTTAQEADTAKNALDGRYFDRRQVKAQIYDQHLFEHQDLSG